MFSRTRLLAIIWLYENVRCSAQYDKLVTACTGRDHNCVRESGEGTRYAHFSAVTEQVAPIGAPFVDNAARGQRKDKDILQYTLRHAQALRYDIELFEGDALFLPEGWTHWIFSGDKSISANLWFSRARLDAGLKLVCPTDSKTTSFSGWKDLPEKTMTKTWDNVSSVETRLCDSNGWPVIFREAVDPKLARRDWSDEKMARSLRGVKGSIWSHFDWRHAMKHCGIPIADIPPRMRVRLKYHTTRDERAVAPLEKYFTTILNFSDGGKNHPAQIFKSIHLNTLARFFKNNREVVNRLEHECSTLFAAGGIPPSVLEPLDRPKVNLWFTRTSLGAFHDTGLHYDQDDSLLVLPRGRKKITLYSPSDAPFLSLIEALDPLAGTLAEYQVSCEPAVNGRWPSSSKWPSTCSDFLFAYYDKGNTISQDSQKPFCIRPNSFTGVEREEWNNHIALISGDSSASCKSEPDGDTSCPATLGTSPLNDSFADNQYDLESDGPELDSEGWLALRAEVAAELNPNMPTAVEEEYEEVDTGILQPLVVPSGLMLWWALQANCMQEVRLAPSTTPVCLPGFNDATLGPRNRGASEGAFGGIGDRPVPFWILRQLQQFFGLQTLVWSAKWLGPGTGTEMLPVEVYYYGWKANSSGIRIADSGLFQRSERIVLSDFLSALRQLVPGVKLPEKPVPPLPGNAQRLLYSIDLDPKWLFGQGSPSFHVYALPDGDPVSLPLQGMGWTIQPKEGDWGSWMQDQSWLTLTNDEDGREYVLKFLREFQEKYHVNRSIDGTESTDPATLFLESWAFSEVERFTLADKSMGPVVSNGRAVVSVYYLGLPFKRYLGLMEKYSWPSYMMTRMREHGGAFSMVGNYFEYAVNFEWDGTTLRVPKTAVYGTL